MSKCYAKDVVKVATKYIGYLEKNSNSYLDDFKKNAGKKNYTKFAIEYQKFTGLNLQANSWCDIWIDAIFVEAYGITNAKKLLGGFNAYTPSSANLFKNMDSWYEINPQVGDVIFFRNSERINHTGLVIEVTSTKVYTIEGNTSSGSEIIENGGGVFYKEYYLSNQRIAGYGRPKYDEDIPLSTITENSLKADIMWLQNKLNICLSKVIGFVPLKVDGSFGTKTIEAVLLYWKQLKWNKDGKDDGTRVGKKTISALASGKVK